MTLSPSQVRDVTRDLLEIRNSERERLDHLYAYHRNSQALGWLPPSVPREVRTLGQAARVNMLDLIVKSASQAMYVDGYRTATDMENLPAWGVWQRNRMDARQIGVHRAGLAYGSAYSVVLPGEPVPVIRGASPRHLTAGYGDDDDWPRYALEKRRSGWRLLDETSVYDLAIKNASDPGGADVEIQRVARHDMTHVGQPVCPVVRYRETNDLDSDVLGLIEPNIPLQDQINITTFGLLVAQHYGAFKQRYIIGWLAESEEQRIKASASDFLTFDDPDVQVGQFDQTDLKGYIESREATLRHLSTVSQTPAHELLGQLVNLSAEALAAAEASHRRAVTEYQTSMGESHEQTLALAAEAAGESPDLTAEVVWRDTESRSLAQTADALGKLVQTLGVPPQEVWELVPGVTQQQVERWKAAQAEGDALGNLAAMLDRQAAPIDDGN